MSACCEAAERVLTSQCISADTDGPVCWCRSQEFPFLFPAFLSFFFCHSVPCSLRPSLHLFLPPTSLSHSVILLPRCLVLFFLQLSLPSREFALIHLFPLHESERRKRCTIFTLSVPVFFTSSPPYFPLTPSPFLLPSLLRFLSFCPLLPFPFHPSFVAPFHASPFLYVLPFSPLSFFHPYFLLSLLPITRLTPMPSRALKLKEYI